MSKTVGDTLVASKPHPPPAPVKPFRILLLGGTGDALAIAREAGSTAVYSLAGLGTTPKDLRCQVRVGGFGGVDGMTRYITQNAIALVLDATHPYAAQISANARGASDVTGVPYWALSRPAWVAEAGDTWEMVSGWDDVMRAIAPYRQVFFTVGREPLRYVQQIPQHQFWHIRCLGLGDLPAHGENACLLAARGPFSVEDERRLFESLGCDVLVTKQSGGPATRAKLHVARERGVKVVMIQRPVLPTADRTFDSVSDALCALRAFAQAAEMRSGTAG